MANQMNDYKLAQQHPSHRQLWREKALGSWQMLLAEFRNLVSTKNWWKLIQAISLPLAISMCVWSCIHDSKRQRDLDKSNSSRQGDAPNEKLEESFSADTVIPAGFVLVPLELENAHTLQNLIGDFGLVDLFTITHLQGGKGRKVGHHLKLLRAPLNPKQFAVLVPESESSRLVTEPGPFVAVIQNPKLSEKAQLLGHPSLPRSRVEIMSPEVKK